MLRQGKNLIQSLKRRVTNMVGAFQYGKGSGFNAERFWGDRLLQHGLGLRGVGNKGLSAEENEEEYRKAKDTFLALCSQEEVDFSNISMIDIGCGNGFYANIARRQGVKQYFGIDITDTLFQQLQKQYLGFRFQKLDVSTQELEGLFDLIIMIDVTQHIVEKEKFSYAMENIKSHLRQHGVFIVTSWLDDKARRSFYETSRSLETYQEVFPGYVLSNPIAFRDKYIFSIRQLSEEHEN